MLCGEIMRQAGLISDAEWNLFLRGTPGAEKVDIHFINLMDWLA